MGHLFVVGLGPGDPQLLTGQARTVLEMVEVVVGYAPYVEQVRAWRPETRFVASAIGAEVERARQALALAADGRRVALVSSGDAGVYGMAALVLEELATYDPALGPTVEVVPGVTALLAAAALLGAPLASDFAAISLSDLLVPWPKILRRVEAAVSADFVLGLYNPASLARDWQLPAVLTVLRAHLPGDTPLGVVREAFRPGQDARVETLGSFDPATADMLTILIVGNSQTRRIGDRLITPRGYQES